MLKLMSVDVGCVGWRVGSIGQNSERGPPKDHSSKHWSQSGHVLSEKKMFKIFPIGYVLC